MQKNWYLGMLGFIGFFTLPSVIPVFTGELSSWELLGVLWFLWFSYFIPVPKNKE
jgi:hypothetical protein